MIASRYQLLEKIGEGGMGVVYKAEDRLTHNHVALKQVLTKAPLSFHRTIEFDMEQKTPPTISFAQHANTHHAAITLANEFRFLASLRHPNIISVLDFGFDERNQPFFTMDWLAEPQNFYEASQSRDTVGKVELVIQLLQALVYLHRWQILHRDLKPTNILVTQDGQVKVLDFGLSQHKDFSDNNDQHIAGTISYLAPEVLLGNAATELSDLYAVGTIMYELLQGTHPFPAETMSALIYNVMSAEPVFDFDTADTKVAEVVLVIQRLMQKDPEARYENAATVVQRLAEIIERPDLIETQDTRESLLQSAPLVGRDEQIEQLKMGWQHTVEQKQPSYWMVGGESGVGKSRLTDEVRIYSLVSGGYLMRGQAINNGAASYQIWRDVARHLALQEALTDLDKSILKGIVPDIARLVGHPVADPPDLDAVSAQERLQGLLVNLIKKLHIPTFIMLEDLQWASEVSLALLQRVEEEVKNQPLMIVVNYRDDEAPELQSLLSTATHIKLEGLPKSHITNLTQSMLGEMGQEQTDSLVDLLETETSGNVFFLVEIMRSLAEQAGSLENLGRITLSPEMIQGGLNNIIRLRLQNFPKDLVPLLTICRHSRA